MYPVYDIIQSEKSPILFHIGDSNKDFLSAKRLSKVMNDFPNLTVIATHMCGHDKWEEAKEFILGKDVYVDTSSTFWRLGAEKKRKLIDLHVTQRVLFGTDYPIERHKYCVESFLKLELSVMTGLKRYSSQMLKNSFFLKKSRKVKK